MNGEGTSRIEVSGLGDEGDHELQEDYEQTSVNWFQLSTQEIVRDLDTDIDRGLDSSEAASRLSHYGQNELEDRVGKPPWQIFIDQFRDVMVMVLIVAGVVSAILGEFTEVVVILAIVILNAILGFTQEYRAEQSMAALKKLAVPTVRVVRDGHILEIPASAIVPGDVVLLEAGNIVPADGRLIENHNLKIQESALTGESDPVEKTTQAFTEAEIPLGDQRNMAFMGTVVTYGRGKMAVTETGMRTELGHIAEMMQAVQEEKTPLQKRLEGLGRTLAWAALVIIVVVMVIGWIKGEDFETLFLTGVSLAVAAIPESLPAVVTITLALGAQRLLRREALIRNLPAVETLGSVTVICSDKTGTLTENQMTVTILDVAGHTQHLDALVDDKGDLMRARLTTETSPELNALSVLVRAGALANDAVLEVDEDGELNAIGDPTEAALVLAAYQLGFEKEDLENEWPRVWEVPFTSERKRMTTVHRMSEEVAQSDLPWRDSPYVVLTKGGVDNLLEITSQVLVNNEIVPLDDDLENRIIGANEEFALQGQRVLGVASRIWDDDEFPEDPDQIEDGLIFVGMVAMMDPPRPEVRHAVEVSKHAGIRPVMITGDHPLTAVQIARDLAILGGGRCMTGQELSALSEKELAEVVEEVSVYARVSPENKINIVNAWQSRDQVVAMTGDGVNDAPALRGADIGVAMGIAGTDVSKEAADMILLDDNFTTIVRAVQQGRVIYDNIRKFIKYTLSSNFGELLIMLVGPLLGMPLPLLPLQILWVNLITDGLPGVALAEEPGERGVMDRAPYQPGESIFSRGVGSQIIWIGSLLGLIALAVGYGAWLSDETGSWQTMAFTTLVFAQMGNVMAIRSSKDTLLEIGIASNKYMLAAVSSGIILQLLLIYVPFMQVLFKTRPLSLLELAICIVASFVVFFTVEVSKVINRLREGK